jgi:hypothetical protein
MPYIELVLRETPDLRQPILEPVQRPLIGPQKPPRSSWISSVPLESIDTAHLILSTLALFDIERIN